MPPQENFVESLISSSLEKTNKYPAMRGACPAGSSKKKSIPALFWVVVLFLSTPFLLCFFLHVFVVDLGLAKMKPTKQKHELEGVWLVEMT